jgi:Coenzyme PQQ synthesis protein D (PqqD)
MRIRSEGLSWQEIDGELVILDLQASTYLTTNKSGAFLAKLLTEERTIEELVGAMAAEYQLEKDRARTDVGAFLAELQRKTLLL